MNVPKTECCAGYDKHLMGCTHASAQDKGRVLDDACSDGKVNEVLGSEPLLPHSVKVENNWTDKELYPHSAFTFKPA